MRGDGGQGGGDGRSLGDDSITLRLADPLGDGVADGAVGLELLARS
jgi:hypothetical protein